MWSKVCVFASELTREAGVIVLPLWLINIGREKCILLCSTPLLHSFRTGARWITLVWSIGRSSPPDLQSQVCRNTMNISARVRLAEWDVREPLHHTPTTMRIHDGFLIAADMLIFFFNYFAEDVVEFQLAIFFCKIFQFIQSQQQNKCQWKDWRAFLIECGSTVN